MPMQYWTNEKTEKSLAALNRIAKEIDFVLIGGWAVYFYVRAQMSEDVDVAISYDSIEYFRKFGLKDYDGINVKYTVLDDGTVIDIFLEQYSDNDLPFPVQDIMSNYSVIGRIKVVSKEMLLLLKLWGYFRFDEIKHRKDVIDVLTLLFYGDIDMEGVKKIADRYNIDHRRSDAAILEYLDKGQNLQKFITETPEEYSALKKKYKELVQKTFG